MEKFYVFLTFDIDQDFAINSDKYYSRSKINFKGLEKGLPKIMKEIKGLPFSVFVRADRQIKEMFGKYNYLIANYSDIFREVLGNQGEINWHIHLYHKKGNEWLQIKDNEKIINCFNKDYNQIKEIPEINSDIVRIGECVMTDGLMSTLNENNIKIDSSALPGRKRKDKEKFFNWEDTGNQFYFPSRSNYQLEGENSYDLLEVPLTTINIKAEYDKISYRRYINLAFKTDYLFQNLKEFIKKNNYLITITHPYEILNEGTHGLISYDFKTFKKNLWLLKESIIKANKKPVFMKIGDILDERCYLSIF